MAVERLYPNGDDTIGLSQPFIGTHWDKVDEDPADGSAYAGTSSDVNVQAGLKLGATTVYGTSRDMTATYTTYTDSGVARPGGGSWSQSDLNSLKVVLKVGTTQDIYTLTDTAIPSGATINSVSIVYVGKTVTGKLTTTQVDAIYVDIDYSTGHPAPTDVEIERQTNPTNASEYPIFTAIWQATGDSGSAVAAYVQVSDDSGFSNLLWDSGWITITSIADNTRCEQLKYDGDYLSRAVTYYVRIKFKDGSDTASVWSSTATMQVTQRHWHVPGFANRKLLTLDPTTNPSGLSVDENLQFEFRTGHRLKVASDGFYNEAIQASGNFNIIYHKGKRYVAYLGTPEISDGNAYAKLAVIDDLTGEITNVNSGMICSPSGAGQPGDTHNYPSPVIDGNDYLYLIMAEHEGQVYFVKTSNPLPDVSSWGAKTTTSGFEGAVATNATYPETLYIAEHGRIYIFYRDTRLKYSFIYSDNGGGVWRGPYELIFNNHADGWRTYAYGFQYDAVRKRLWFGFTYTNYIFGEISVGVWCCYSDLDETDGSSFDVGFNIWREADGTLWGRTAQNASYGTRQPVGYLNASNWVGEIGKSILFFATDTAETDWTGGMFCMELNVLPNGYPVVFYDQVPLKDSYNEPAPVGAGVWTGSAWQIVNISDQINYEVVVGRSGVSAMCDRNGIMRMFMPIKNRPTFYFVPNTDALSVDCTPSSGSDNYAMVDDGITYIDGELSYISLTPTTGKATFTDSATGMRPNVNVRSVLVLAECRQSSATTSTGKMILKIGGTEYESTEFDVDNGEDRWYRKVGQWEITNPDTSLPWEVADLPVEFGIKCTHATVGFEVTRILLGVEYYAAESVESANQEVIEVQSTDGLNWEFVGFRTGSTSQGQPIMSRKHQLTNQTVEIVWTCGSEIFLLSDEVLGTVRGDCRDLKIIHGDAEIDRVVDFGGLEHSLVSFKVQEAIAAGATNTPKDYYLYWNGPGVEAYPKSNPTNVLLFHESFETGETGDDLDGFNSWAAESGAGYIETGPPAHNNKIAHGNRTARLTAIGSRFSNTIGSGLSNVHLSGRMFIEGSNNSYSWIGLANATADIGVGTNRVGPYPGVWDGVWNSLTALKAYNTIMHYVDIFLSDYGVSMYIDGLEIAFQDYYPIVEAGADDVVLYAGDTEAYFDLIEVSVDNYHALRYAGTIVDSVLFYDADATATYQSSPDGKVESAQDGVRSIILTIGAGFTTGETSADVHIRVHLSDSPTYDSGSIVAVYEALIEDVTTSTAANHQVKIAMHSLPAGQYSCKVDLYQVDGASDPAHFYGLIISADYLVPGTPPVVQLQDEEISGVLVGRVLRGAGEGSFGVGRVIAGDFMRRQVAAIMEAMAGVGRVGAIALEYKSLVAALKAGQLEHLADVDRYAAAGLEEVAAMNPRTGAVITEHLVGIDRPALALVESLSNLSGGTTAAISVEFLAAADRLAQAGFEHAVAAVRAAQPELEHLVGVNRSGHAVLEYQGTVVIERACAILLEHLGSIDRPGAVLEESLFSLSRPLRLVAEGLIGIDRGAAAVAEYLSLMARAGAASNELLCRVQAVTTAEIETTAGAVRSIAPVTESLSSISRAAAAIVEWMGTVQISRSAHIMIENLSSLVRSGHTLTEGLVYVSGQNAVVTEALSAIERDARAVLEYAGTVSVIAPAAILIEHLAGANRPANVSAEHIRTVQVTGSVITEQLISAIRPASVVTENMLLTQVNRALQIPIEILQAVSAPKSAIIENLSSLSRSAQIDLEYKSSIVRKLATMTEQTISFTTNLAVSTEQLIGIIRKSNIPVAWYGTLFTAVALCNIRIMAPTLVSVTLTAPELAGLKRLLPRIENLALNSTELEDLVLKSAEVINVELKGKCNG